MLPARVTPPEAPVADEPYRPAFHP
jgi:hypothetical protein